MADSIDVPGGHSPEDIAFKLLYAISWSENIDLEGWGKTDRKWILDTYAECLLAVKNPAERMAQAPVRASAAPKT
jgi:hypothetical protein